MNDKNVKLPQLRIFCTITIGLLLFGDNTSQHAKDHTYILLYTAHLL